MHNDVFLNHISERFVALNPLSMAEHLVDASCLFIYHIPVRLLPAVRCCGTPLKQAQFSSF